MGRETKSARAKRQAFARHVFVSVLRAAGNVVEEEYRFDAKRKWRFDLAIPVCGLWLHPLPVAVVSLAIEVEGLGGRHQATGGFIADMEKYNAASAARWMVFRFTTRQIEDGHALDVLARAGVAVTAARGK